MVKLLRPNQLGWLRLPELDYSAKGEVWELPNGSRHVHNPNIGPLVIAFSGEQHGAARTTATKKTVVDNGSSPHNVRGARTKSADNLWLQFTRRSQGGVHRKLQNRE